MAVPAVTGVTSDLAAVEAACRGLGIVRLPAAFASGPLHSGRLQRLLEDEDQQPVDVFILLPAGRRKSARLRAIEEWVRSCFADAA